MRGRLAHAVRRTVEKMLPRAHDLERQVASQRIEQALRPGSGREHDSGRLDAAFNGLYADGAAAFDDHATNFESDARDRSAFARKLRESVHGEHGIAKPATRFEGRDRSIVDFDSWNEFAHLSRVDDARVDADRALHRDVRAHTLHHL